MIIKNKTIVALELPEFSFSMFPKYPSQVEVIYDFTTENSSG